MNVKHSMRNIMLQSTYYAPVTHLLPYYAPITHMLRTNYHIKHLLRTCYAPITDLSRTYYAPITICNFSHQYYAPLRTSVTLFENYGAP